MRWVLVACALLTVAGTAGSRVAAGAQRVAPDVTSGSTPVPGRVLSPARSLDFTSVGRLTIRHDEGD